MKAVLFHIQDPVTIAGQPIKAIYYIRITEDLKNATIVEKLTHKCSSKVIKRKKIYFNPFAKHKIPDTEILKDEVANVSMESFAEPHKKYQLFEDNFTRVYRKYGKAPKYEKHHEIYCGPLKRGDYQYHAIINTLDSFPSSFMFRSENRKKLAAVSYKLSITVLDDNEIYHQASTDIHIDRQVIPRPIKQSTEGNIIQSLCCLFNRGTVELSISLDKNVFEPGEYFQLSYTLDNSRSQRAIDRIEVRIVTRLTLIDQSYEENIVQEIAQINTYKGVPSGNTGIFQKKIQLPADLKATINTEFIRYCVFLQIEAIPAVYFSFMSIPTLIQVPIVIKKNKFKRQIPNLDSWQVPKNINSEKLLITGAQYLSSGIPFLGNSEMTQQSQSQMCTFIKLPQMQNSGSYQPLIPLPNIAQSEFQMPLYKIPQRHDSDQYMPLVTLPKPDEGDSYIPLIKLPKVENSESQNLNINLQQQENQLKPQKEHQIRNIKNQHIQDSDICQSYIKLPNFFQSQFQN